MGLSYVLGLFFLFLIVVFPQGHQLLKGCLLLIIFTEIFISFTKSNKLHLSKKIFLLFIFYILLGSVYGIYGFALNNPGTIEITKEVVLYVFVAMILVSCIRQIRHIKVIHNTLVFSTLFLTAYIVITILNANGVWPDWLYANLAGANASQSVAVGSLVSEGRIDIGFSSLPSFLFLQSYLFCFALASKERPSKPLLISVFSSTAFMIFSGSRILFIAGFFMPIAIIIYVNKNKWQVIKSKMKIKPVILWTTLSLSCVFLMLQLGFSMQAVGWDFIRAFLPYELTNIYESGDILRSAEIIPNRRLNTLTHLYSAWMERPFFGAGSGAVYWEFIRSGTEPWKYELSFMQFLYHWGILGCGLYLGGLVYIYRNLAKIFKQNSVLGPYALSAAFGSIAFILGSATNPFLLRFDSIFAVFLPIAVLNIYLMNSKYRYN